MDLRVRLLAWLALWAGLWLALVLALTVLTLKRGIADESVGADALIELLTAAADAQADPSPERLQALQAIVAGQRFRHLRASWEAGAPAGPGPQPAPPEVSGPLQGREPGAAAPSQALVAGVAAWFSAPREAAWPALTHRLVIGDRVLILAPDPQAEVAEVLEDNLPLMAAWCVVGLLMMLTVVVIVARALAPARELCAGLARLEAGAAEPGFGRFKLREYHAIARGIEAMAGRLGRARQAQRQLSQRLIALQEDERRSLARDLHDDLGQHLTALAAMVALLQRHPERQTAESLRERADALQAELRGISGRLRLLLAQLRPHGLSTAGLREELQTLIAQWRQRCPDVALDLDEAGELPPLDEAATLVFYRAMQEALTNAYRHAGARRIVVRWGVATRAGRLQGQLSVEDDGRGLGPDPEAVLTRGTGLQAMRERVEGVGGELHLGAAAAGGFRVALHLPADLAAGRPPEPDPAAEPAPESRPTVPPTAWTLQGVPS